MIHGYLSQSNAGVIIWTILVFVCAPPPNKGAQIPPTPKLSLPHYCNHCCVRPLSDGEWPGSITDQLGRWAAQLHKLISEMMLNSMAFTLKSANVGHECTFDLHQSGIVFLICLAS